MEQIEVVLQEVNQETNKEANQHFAVLFIDLDRFKVINDSLGHDVGDQLLIEIARRLKRNVRSADIVARLGGDEFTILLKSIHCLQDATEIAERILSDLSIPFHLRGHQFVTSASIGILEGSRTYDNSISLLRDADTAMYSAKNNGKARYVIFHKEMHAQSLHIWHLESALQHALERNELSLHYQPVTCLKSGQTKGVEALLRWQHPDRGMIPPDQFIPIAEDSGLILVIGEWVLQEACRQLKEWHERFPEYSPLTVSVNIASKQLQEVHFVNTVDRILSETGLQGSALILELTENTLIENTGATLYTIQQLRDRQIHLSIDDFGKGYSSLSYLNQIPLESLKIDRSFTRQIDVHRKKSLNIIQGITSLAHSLGLKVVIEGIETAEQMQQAVQLNCEFGQGYYFSPPLPVHDFEQWLQRQRQHALL
jgi:diguanylate cyclase (GGDEF)-like protein